MNTKISSLIKDKRVELSLTQEELAVKTFVSRQAVSNWERGKSQPDFDSLKILSKELDIDIDKFLWNDLELVKRKLNIRNMLVILLGVILLIILSIQIYNKVYPVHKRILSEYTSSEDYIFEEIDIQVLEDTTGNKTLSVSRTKTEILKYPFGNYYVPFEFEYEWDEDELILDEYYPIYKYVLEKTGIYRNVSAKFLYKQGLYFLEVHYVVHVASDEVQIPQLMGYFINITDYVYTDDDGDLKLITG